MAIRANTNSQPSPEVITLLINFIPESLSPFIYDGASATRACWACFDRHIFDSTSIFKFDRFGTTVQIRMSFVAAPQVVKSLKMDFVSAGRLRAQWQPPSDAGKNPVDGYRLRLYGYDKSSNESGEFEVNETTKDIHTNLTDSE